MGEGYCGSARYTLKTNLSSDKDRDILKGSAMRFEGAQEAMRQGKAVARHGWNGKGVFIYLVPAAAYPAQTGVAKRHFGENALVPYGAYTAMKTADGNVVPWLCSQSDMWAPDWVVVDDPKPFAEIPDEHFAVERF